MSGMELWWLGQSGFRLSDPDHGPVVFIDPFLSDHPHRAYPAPAGAQDLAAADLVICTHEHIDHFDKPVIQAASALPGSHFILVLPEPIVSQALELGIPEDRIRGAQPGETIEISGVCLYPVPARHGIHVKDAYNFGEALSGGEVRYLGFVIELGGVRVYHAGDTIPYPDQIQRLSELKPDITLLPINGRDFFRETERDIVGNLTPDEAVRLTHDMGARILIPAHWDMFPHNPGFPYEVVEYAVQHYPEMTILAMGRGAKITIL